MYNNEDRGWMYDRMNSSTGYLNSSFEEGVSRFLDYAFSRTDLLNDRKARCPCKKCCNSKFWTSDKIMNHLYNRGFLDQYYVWVAHGELTRNFMAPDTDVGGSSSHTTTDRFREMVDDVFGGRFENLNYNEAVNELPNKEAQLFFKLLKEAEAPIHEGSNVTALQWVAEFMTNKIEHNFSAVGCNVFIQQVHNLLSPEDSGKLPNSVYNMKRLLSTLGLGHITYDVCVNNCFLYYGEYESSNFTSCPQCEEERYEEKRNTTKKSKRITRKKLWYFPLTPRLQRLYMARNTAEHMTWHLKCKGDGDTMIHPASGDAWKQFDATYPDYAAEARNVRLGLCTYGFTPWGNSSAPYSCWPVFVTPYNLPPDLCMRQEFIFLSLLIAGPKSPGKNIDVMLRPLIDELRFLWKYGVQTYDSFRKQNFIMRAHVMWTISDFPAYGMLSQWSTHGRLSCPYCMENTKAFRLKHGRKFSFFDCHRRFLPLNHPLRGNTTAFKLDRTEEDAPLHRRLGHEMKRHVRHLPKIGFGQCGEFIEGFGVIHNWCRRSIFWELPYWESNMIRHNLDVMHCEKNFFDNIKNIVMDDPEKSKDNKNARKDLQLWTNRSELFLHIGPGGQQYKAKAMYSLSKEQKVLVCEWLRDVKFPDGYVSNISRCVQMQQLRLVGLKSHDCHVFMQRLMPIAFHGFLQNHIWKPLTEVSIFFRALCATELSRSTMEELERSIVITMCKLEKIFPPSFFDSMEHLAIHLPWEAKVGGPVQYRWMYPFERRMLELKRSVGNKARIEGSISEAYLITEVTNFMKHYFDKRVETRANRLNRNEVSLNVDFTSELTIFQCQGRPLGSGRDFKQLTVAERKAAELYVLLNCPEVDPWLRLFDEEMCHGLSLDQIERRRNIHFVRWFKECIKSNRYKVDPRIRELAKGPSMSARVRKGYIINGFRFHTVSYAKVKKTNNWGIYVKASNDGTTDTNFYGSLQEIIEVEYWGSHRCLTTVLFKCDWYDLTRGLFVHPKYKLIDIDPNMRLASGESDPFILASQAQQACYLSYPSQQNSRRERWAVCPIRARYVVDTTSLKNTNDTLVQGPNVYQESSTPVVRVEVEQSGVNMRNLASNEFERVEEDEVDEDDDDDDEEEEEEEEEELEEHDFEDEEELVQDNDSDPDYEIGH